MGLNQLKTNPNIALTVGALNANNSTGSTGQYLESTGTGTRWSSLNISALTGLTLKNYTETVNSLGNTGTNTNINLADGNFVTARLTQNCVFQFTTTQSSSQAISFTLVLTNDDTGGRTITWPTSVKWPNGTVPTRTTTANKTDVYTFFSYDGGTTWWGALSLYNYS